MVTHENYCRKGKEGIGKELNISEVEPSHGTISDCNLSANIHELFAHWQSTMNHPHAKLDKKRQTTIQKALQLGYNVVELKQAIDGCAKTPFNIGQNDRQQVYDDICLIFRDAEHIERFMNNASNSATIKSSPC